MQHHTPLHSRFKTILLILALILQSTPLTLAAEPAGAIERTFRLSAYYSPEPGQSFYAMGSYEADLRMNGMGVAGASGTAVYPGMLAAPKTYAFGTSIYLEGIGVGTVWDRGGAIVQAGERGQSYDRLDIWVGRGEEGLKRALSFGKRTVRGKVYPPGAGVADSINLSSFGIARSLAAPTTIASTTTVESSPWNRTLSMGDSGSDVTLLQEELKKLGHFNGNTTGTYGQQTADAVLSFQRSERIVSSKQDFGAGVFGPLTKSKLLQIQKNPATAKAVLKEDTPKTTPAPTTITIGGGANLKAPELSFHISSTSTTKIENISILNDIQLLQIELKERGFYTGPVTGEMDTATSEALIEFQVQAGVISSKQGVGAGFYGPRTKDALKQELVATKAASLTPEVVAAIPWDVPKGNLVSYTTYDRSIPLPALKYGEGGEHVYILQQELRDMGLYEGLLTGIYDEGTHQAVLFYQVTQGILFSPSDYGAGVFGPKTSAHFNGFRGTGALISGGRPAEVELGFDEFARTQEALERLLAL